MIVIMNGLRKFGLWLSALVIGPALLIAVVAFSVTRTLGNPAYVKQTFAEVKVYQALGNFLQAEAEKSAGSDNPTVQKALAKTATTERLQTISEQAVDQAYAVLNGDIHATDFSVDITEFKQAFLQNLDNDLTKQLAELPACSFANPPTSTDILASSCLPTGADIDKIVAQAKQQTVSENELLQAGAVDLTNISNPQAQAALNGQTTAADSAQISEQFQQLADVYQQSKLVLPIAAGVGVISALGVVLLSQSRLRGGRRLGVLLLGNGLVLVVLSFVARMLGQNFPINTGEGTLLPATAFELAGQTIVIDLATLIMQLSLAVFVIGLGITVLVSVMISKQKPKPETASKNKPGPPPP